MRAIERKGRRDALTASGTALLALLVIASSAAAGPDIDLLELSIEDLMNVTVRGASKYEQTLNEAPASVSVVTADEIRKQGYRTLSDILRSIRSFYVTYDRNYSYVGVRGFGRPVDYNSRILMLIDGHRINENIYDSFGIGTDGILDVDLIDRIEVIRGPGSSLYGSNAFFAVVNIIMKQGADIRSTEASGEAASFGASKGRISYGDRHRNGLDVVLSGSVQGSGGQDLYYKEFDPALSSDPRAANGGVAQNADYDRSHSFFTRLSKNDITLSGAYASRTKGIPTGSFGADFNEPGTKTADERGYVDLSMLRHITDRTDLFAALSYDLYRYTGDYLYSGVVNRDLVNGARWGGELRIISRAATGHNIVGGAEYQGDLRQDQQNYDVSPYFSYTDDKRRSVHAAVYIQDEITVSETLLVNAGIRYDKYESFGGTINPRLALIYAPAPMSRFKLLYGTAFRAPNVYEMYYSAPTSSPPELPNPALHPERITTYELAYEQYFHESLRGTATVFSHHITDLIDRPTDPAAIQQYNNTDRVTTRGAELELEHRGGNGVNGRISYSFQHSENEGTGQIQTNSPEHMVKLNVMAPVVRPRIFAGIEGQYIGRRETGPDDQRTVLPGYFIVNLTVFSQHLARRLDLSASIYNLFDERYADPVSGDFIQTGIEQDGRSYRVKLTYRF